MAPALAVECPLRRGHDDFRGAPPRIADEDWTYVFCQAFAREAHHGRDGRLAIKQLVNRQTEGRLDDQLITCQRLGGLAGQKEGAVLYRRYSTSRSFRYSTSNCAAPRNAAGRKRSVQPAPFQSRLSVKLRGRRVGSASFSATISACDNKTQRSGRAYNLSVELRARGSLWP